LFKPVANSPPTPVPTSNIAGACCIQHDGDEPPKFLYTLPKKHPSVDC